MTDPLARLRALPRVPLAHLPTPLEEMPRLAKTLGIPSLWVKRDDCTGLGFGGNKVRKLEFGLAAALEMDADCVVCGGVTQSNVARQVAAACARLGLECHLGIMRGRLPPPEPSYETSGNILLDQLYGAVIHDIPWDEDRNRNLQAIVETLRAAGRNPFLVPYGASDARGALGYALAAEEIVQACPDVGWIVHASGSAGTQSGLLAGLLALGHHARVIGIDVDAEPDRLRADVQRLGRETAALLGCEERWSDDLVEVAGEFSAHGYGVPGPDTAHAIRVGARLEGLALDPVYTGKAMAGLIGLVATGRFSDKSPIVWIHTGGTPGIFAYADFMSHASGCIEPAGQAAL